MRYHSVFGTYLIRFTDCGGADWDFIWDENAGAEQKSELVLNMAEPQYSVCKFEQATLYNNTGNNDPDNPRPRKSRHFIADLGKLPEMLDWYHDKHRAVAIKFNHEELGNLEDLRDGIAEYLTEHIAAFENPESECE